MLNIIVLLKCFSLERQMEEDMNNDNLGKRKRYSYHEVYSDTDSDAYCDNPSTQ
jgi:hypothetical protein